MKYADAGGVRIAYDDKGPWADDAVVFLGGWQRAQPDAAIRERSAGSLTSLDAPLRAIAPISAPPNHPAAPTSCRERMVVLRLLLTVTPYGQDGMGRAGSSLRDCPVLALSYGRAVLAFQLGCDGSAQLAPALLELGQAVTFQVFGDVIEIDARCR